MFNKMPMLAINTTKLVLPLLTNGNGTPVGGMLALTTAMFISAWLAITAVIPVASKPPNLSGALLAIFTPFIIIIKNNNIVIVAPKRPSSSQIIENIKSLSLNGKNIYF